MTDDDNVENFQPDHYQLTINNDVMGILSTGVCFTLHTGVLLIMPVSLREMEEDLATGRSAGASFEIWASRIPLSLANANSASCGIPSKPVKLFLGSGRDASNAEKLRENGVTHILNVADNVENFHPGHFVYCNLNVRDFGADAGISRVFDQAADFIRNAVFNCEPEPGILVHCYNGSNRSSTVVIACLMILQGLDLKTAFDTVKKAHPKTYPFEDNRRQLMDFERRLYPGKADTDYHTLQLEERRRRER